MAKKSKSGVVSVQQIEGRILGVRGHRVIVDADLATLYGVTTKRLNEQVRRNADRFPADFVFQLSAEEKREVVANCDHLAKLKFSATRPNVFTEHGAIMAASVLNTPQAVDVGIYVVRAFIRLREMLATNKALARKLDELESKVQNHDDAITAILSAIRELMTPEEPEKKRRIGFIQEE